MQRVNYIIFRVVVFFISLLPFPLLYLFSDFTAFIFQRVVGYRVKVVQSNLLKALPEKSDAERKEIENAFYKSLTDLIVESLKGYGSSGKTIQKRTVSVDIDKIDPYLKRGQSVLLVGGHMGNWEWFCNNFAELNLPASVIFKPLTNLYINKFLYKQRARGDVRMVPMAQTARAFAAGANETRVFTMVADQNPSRKSKGYWLDFFGIDTVFLHGPEKYSHLYNLPTFYGQVKRKERGYYSLHFDLLSENPAELEDGELTKRYAERLEAGIREQPEAWLWSHKRWKHSR